MRKHIKLAAVVMFVAVVGSGLAALLAPTPASAASNCWRVDCNTCCRIGNGKVVCTQRACV
jgi:hypothetical protein